MDGCSSGDGAMRLDVAAHIENQGLEHLTEMNEKEVKHLTVTWRSLFIANLGSQLVRLSLYIELCSCSFRYAVHYATIVKLRTAIGGTTEA